ncbi:hypothetical protein [Paenibacillus medicaginis]|uniref:Uncharacterized protein n=1 Tax=Paenibacillus medicaginis TaxID=1470560 RepID=A0ABV5C7M1_9BACL
MASQMLVTKGRQYAMADPRSSITSDMLGFFKQNVLTVTDITRTKKLTEILDSYASSEPNEKVFVVQNSRNKEAQAVIADLDFFFELLQIKEAVEESIDDMMYQITLEREADAANVDLSQVIDELDLDMTRIMRLVEGGDLD